MNGVRTGRKSRMENDLTTGCDDCRISQRGMPSDHRSRIVMQESVKSAFTAESTHNFFNAQIGFCPSCRTPYLEAYDEEDSDTEWGKRIWVCNPLTDERRSLLLAAVGTESLDFADFRGDMYFIDNYGNYTYIGWNA